MPRATRVQAHCSFRQTLQHSAAPTSTTRRHCSGIVQCIQSYTAYQVDNSSLPAVRSAEALRGIPTTSRLAPNSTHHRRSPARLLNSAPKCSMPAMLHFRQHHIIVHGGMARHGVEGNCHLTDLQCSTHTCRHYHAAFQFHAQGTQNSYSQQQRWWDAALKQLSAPRPLSSAALASG
jgi:hypothetical protein